ncbi:MAG: winged helix-turn-helix domain-containing protein [Chloroflexota bacterium]
MPSDSLTPLVPIPDVSVALEPALNAFTSLFMMAKTERLPGLNAWVGQTLDAMSPQERQEQRLVMIGLYYALLPERNWSSFPAHVSWLEKASPAALRERMLVEYTRMHKKSADCWECTQADSSTHDWTTVLANEDSYLSFLHEHFEEEDIDDDLERSAYHLALDPPAMQKQIAAYLRHAWEGYLSAEWERTRPMLQECVLAFGQVDFSQMSRLEAAEYITGQTLSGTKFEHLVSGQQRLVFIPNPHVGPYLTHFELGEVRFIVFGARPPKGILTETPDLSRTEILVRLSALADDTRLGILRYIAENGEQRSQEIMRALDLSQSGVSRHLMQLSATGFLSERRCEGAKCYVLGQERLQETLQALSAFLLLDS